jgi:hypothetical protein
MSRPLQPANKESKNGDVQHDDGRLKRNQSTLNNRRRSCFLALVPSGIARQFRSTAKLTRRRQLITRSTHGRQRVSINGPNRPVINSSPLQQQQQHTTYNFTSDNKRPAETTPVSRATQPGGRRSASPASPSPVRPNRT